MRNAKRSMRSFSFADSAECHQKRAEEDSHTAQPLGGLRLDSLCCLMSTRRQARAVGCDSDFFPPLSFECFIYFHFHWPFFIYLFFSRDSTRIQTKKENVTIWGLHMEKPDSAQLLCFSHPESTLLVKLSAKWPTC